MYQTGFITFLAGFAIWNVDNIYCSTLTEWKKAVGWPTAFLLEGTNHILSPYRTLPMRPTDGRALVVAWFDRTQVSPGHSSAFVSPRLYRPLART